MAVFLRQSVRLGNQVKSSKLLSFPTISLRNDAKMVYLSTLTARRQAEKLSTVLRTKVIRPYYESWASNLYLLKFCVSTEVSCKITIDVQGL